VAFARKRPMLLRLPAAQVALAPLLDGLTSSIVGFWLHDGNDLVTCAPTGATDAINLHLCRFNQVCVPSGAVGAVLRERLLTHGPHDGSLRPSQGSAAYNKAAAAVGYSLRAPRRPTLLLHCNSNYELVF